MNRLFKKNNSIEDEFLNLKIEQIFDNKLFQRVVEKTDVLEDADGSASRSFVYSQKLLESGIVTENPSFLRMKATGDVNSEPHPHRIEKKEKLLIDFSESDEIQDQKKGKSTTQNQETNLKMTGAEIGKNKLKFDFLKNKQMPMRQHLNSIFKKGNLKQNNREKSDFDQNQKAESSRASDLTFTDRQKISIDDSKNEILDDFTHKMQNDLGNLPSEISLKESSDSSSVNDPKMDIFDEKELAKELGFRIIEIDSNHIDSVFDKLNSKYKLLKNTIGREKRTQNNYLKSMVSEKNTSTSLLHASLPQWTKFPQSNDSFYPKKYENTVFDSISLKVIVDRERTGFEESKDFAIIIDSVIAARYKVIEFLGTATFSKAIHVQDLTNGRHLCLKIIENNKDYFDQSLDEVKMLLYINANSAGNPDQHNIINFYEFFYFKEHLFIVTELLKDNLYEYYRFNSEHETEKFFTLDKLKIVSRQVFKSLAFLHSIHVIHCDIKPENLMVKSYSKNEFRLIDFGSACFIHDHLSSYVQSRFYRAPEVILGCFYDYKVDVWSLGCVICELFLSQVLFQGHSLAAILALVIGTIGPIPEWMLKKGKTVSKYFTKEFLLFDSGSEEIEGSEMERSMSGDKLQILAPVKSSLQKKLDSHDSNFLDFIGKLLKIDPNERFTAAEALAHPWLKN